MARKVISLFTGAGGLDLGLEAAGFDVAVAVEMDQDAVATVRANRDWRIMQKQDRLLPVEEVVSRDLLKAGKLRIGEASLLAGGPPCQPFSKAGYWASGDSARLDDPRADTLEQYLRILRDTQPEAYLLENVPGLGFDGKDEGLNLIRRRIKEINGEIGTSYSFSVAQLNAAHFGVPQLRQRVFVIGHRDGKQFRFPEPSHYDSEDSPRDRRGAEPFLTAWDAIGDLADDDAPDLRMTGRWARLLSSIPEGRNYLWHTDRGGGRPLFGWRTRFWTFLLKLAKTRPAWTIQAQPGPAIGPFHWRNRRLSADELCRLQTFPDGYKVLGSLRVAQKLLGNAVPSALAELLGREIRAQLLGDRISRKVSLLPGRAPSIPRAERVGPVPCEYLHLVGTHAAHRGTGLGPAALRREKTKKRATRGTFNSPNRMRA